jgi:hypothetical protein
MLQIAHGGKALRLRGVNSTKNNATVRVTSSNCIDGVPNQFVVKAHGTYTIADVNVSVLCAASAGRPSEINWSLSGARPHDVIYSVYKCFDSARSCQGVNTTLSGDRNYLKATCNGEACMQDSVITNLIDSDVVIFQLVDPVVVQSALDSD